jgi:hypothetical protein
LVVAREGRYGLLFCVPIVCFCAIALQSAGEWLGQRPKGWGLSRPAVVGLTLVLCGAQAWIVSGIKVPSVKGIKEAAAFVERVAPNEPVFYDGHYGGVFTFYLQAGDPGFKRRVVLGSKLLFASAIDALGRYKAFVRSQEEVVQALQTRGGSRWLAVEISRQTGKVPVSVLLQKAVRGPEFELVRSFPVTGPGLDRIDLYRFKLDPQATDEADLPFPILGENVRFKIRPIER